MEKTDITSTDFLDELMEILDEDCRDKLHPCIRDLVVNGLQLSRMLPSVNTPNRQSVTQYLAAWCLSAGLSEVVCKNWLSGFAMARLSSISKSSPSGIRHSTKSNVKYIYRDLVAFFCECEKNPFRAECSTTCTVYSEMIDKKKTPPNKDYYVAKRTDIHLVVVNPSVKEKYKTQFKASMELVRSELAKGTKKTAILEMLKKQGLKTKTGREWKYSTLRGEIVKLEKA